MRKSGRNIMHFFTHHKPMTTASLVTTITVCLALLVSGCGGGGKSSDETAPPSSSGPVSIRTTVKTTDLDAWLSIANRLTRDDRVQESDYSQLLSLPAYSQINGSGARRLNPIILQNVMSYAFAPRDENGRIEWLDRKPKRHDLAVNFTYCADHMEQLQAFSNDMKNRDLGAEILSLVDGYLSRKQLPDQLIFSFLVANNSISFVEPDEFIIDAVLGIAAEPHLLPHIIAANVYRQFSGMSENNPANAPAGAETIRRTMRRVRQEGIAAWIESLPEIMFDQQHEILVQSNRHHTEVIYTGDKYLGSFTNLLAEIMDPDKNLLADNSTAPHDHLNLNKVYQHVGYAMAALIADHFGEDKLKAVSGSTLDFLDAYQQAALDNTSQYELGDMDPFPEKTYQKLIDMISQ